MAIITSHFLNGIDGTHAGNVAASLLRIDADGTRKLLQECLSGSDGRLQIDALTARLTLKARNMSWSLQAVPISPSASPRLPA